MCGITCVVFRVAVGGDQPGEQQQWQGGASAGGPLGCQGLEHLPLWLSG